MTRVATIDVRFRGDLGRFRLDAEFTVPARGVTAMFGPSGCGKTSVLRCIAGLTRLNDGYCDIAGDVWQDKARFRPVHERPLGYVFQEASLFPHLSVLQNLRFGEPAKTQDGQIALDEAVSLLGLEPLLERRPSKLSGGERQRVAIGRALLSQPRILLMDEPLSALDRLTKDEILPFLERLHARLSIPVLYVSHDMSEIERLADHLVLMDKGRVIAAGPIGDLQSDPALPLFSAQDSAASLDGVVASFDEQDSLMTIAVPGGAFLVPAGLAEIGSPQRLRIPASNVSLARDRPGPSTIVNVLPARILEAQGLGGPQITIVLGLGPDGDGARLLARITSRSWRQLGLSLGQDVWAQVKGAALVRPV